MSNHERVLSIADILELRRSMERKPKRVSRKQEGKGPRDNKALDLLAKHQERLNQVLKFSITDKLPPCPKCNGKLVLERKFGDDSRLICTNGHSTDVIRISATFFWVRADFFGRFSK